jgi:hypothetical protein
MSVVPVIRLRCPAASLLTLSLAGCSATGGHSPAIDVLGSYFPAWLICIVVGLVLTIITRLLFIACKLQPSWPALVYPCLVAVFALTVWLLFFRN